MTFRSSEVENNIGMKKLFYFIACVFILVGSACEPDVIIQKEEPLSEHYFPLEIGSIKTYKIDTIYFQLQGKQIHTDTVQWIVTETITDTSRAEDKRLLYHIQRTMRKPQSEEKISVREWLAWEENGAVVLQIGNLPYIKMQKKLHLGSQWKPNAYFDAQSISVEIKSNFIRPYSVPYLAEAMSLSKASYDGHTTQDSILTVQLVDFDDNYVEKRYSIEKYAPHIGLVEKEEWILNTQCRIKGGDPNDCTGLPWTEKAEEGYIMHKLILSWN